MKSRIALVLFFSVLFVSVPVTAQQNESKTPSTPKPTLVISSLEHSFGVVKPGTVLSHSFIIENIGEAALAITNVRPSCGCITSFYDKEVAPGGSGEIVVEVEKTQHYKGEGVKTVSVTTNDPDHPTFTLTLRADFKSE
ncbi:MAG: DUF1573 domain-containing protein [Candidatus Latescibacterota bacterium]